MLPVQVDRAGASGKTKERGRNHQHKMQQCIKRYNVKPIQHPSLAGDVSTTTVLLLRKNKLSQLLSFIAAPQNKV